MRIGCKKHLLTKEIENNALKFIKAQKYCLPNKFLTYENRSKKAISMAGGFGTGKSETAINISKNELQHQKSNSLVLHFYQKNKRGK